MGSRPESREPVDFEPGDTRNGWQQEAASRVEESFRETNLFPRMGDARKALVRSQGSGAGLARSTCPVKRLTTFTPQVFRVILLRRLHLPLPLTVRNCRCGQPLDICGHHRAACARAGVLGGRGWALENVVARICRECATWTLSDLTSKTTVGSKWLLTGCLFSEVPNSRSTRQWSVHCARRAATHDGVATAEARRRKCRTYPELAGLHGRARLVVLEVEVGGLWSHETQSFLSQLAKAKARGETELMRRRAEQSWRLRWGSFLACTVAQAVASAMLELPSARGADGDIPAPQDVERDCRVSGLAR